MEKVLISSTIDQALWKRFKVSGVRRHLTLRQSLEKALRLYLGEELKSDKPRKPRYREES